jgi:hypothetical protein
MLCGGWVGGGRRPAKFSDEIRTHCNHTPAWTSSSETWVQTARAQLRCYRPDARRPGTLLWAGRWRLHARQIMRTSTVLPYPRAEKGEHYAPRMGGMVASSQHVT